MTTFAIFFMTVSMASVTALAGWCLYRILTVGPAPDEDATKPEEAG
ncbi:MAG: hypothetical protein WBH75_01960 [Thermoanaerobaculia bacterium]